MLCIGVFPSSSMSYVAQEYEENREHPWPCFGGDPQRTGQSPYDTEHVGGAVVWTFDTGGAYSSSPAIDRDGVIYVGSWDNDLYALNPDGSERWRYQTGGDIESSPTIGADGTIYVGSDDTKLYAFNPNGTLKWNFNTEHVVRSSPVIGMDGTIYIGADDGYLYAINPNGTLKWTYRLTHIRIRPWCSPAIGLDGTIYIGSSNSKLYAINPNGTLDWIFDTGSAMWSLVSTAAIGSDGTIYVGSWDNKLYAINPDGTLEWSYRTGGWVTSPAIGADGKIYVISSDDIVHAINPDGSLLWNFRTKGIGQTSPAIGADGTVYIHTIYGIYAFGEGQGMQIKNRGSDLNILSITTGIGIIFSTALLFFKHTKNKMNPYYRQLPKTDGSEKLLSRVNNSVDMKYIAFGIATIVIGLYLFYYVPSSFMYGYTPYPHRITGILTLFIGVSLSVTGLFINKVRYISTKEAINNLPPPC